MNRRYLEEMLAVTRVAKLIAQDEDADTGACQAAMHHTLSVIGEAAAKLALNNDQGDYPPWPTISQFQCGAQQPLAPLSPVTLAELVHHELPALTAAINRELSAWPRP